MGGPGRVVEIGLISLGTSTQVTTSLPASQTIRWIIKNYFFNLYLGYCRKGSIM